ncbi:MAG: JAB domain-containing protein [Christensenellales bacterium]
MHSGHRARLKSKRIAAGQDILTDHELLEMLLYFSIPQKNTNDLAHLLLETFGTIEKALSADYYALQTVPGIGPSSALLIMTAGDLAKRCKKQNLKMRHVLDTVEKGARYCQQLLKSAETEKLFGIFMDSGCRVLHAAPIAEGTVDSIHIDPRKLVQMALHHNTVNMLVAHNHPGGHTSPSFQDIECTQKIIQALTPVGIALLDHFIISGDLWHSIMMMGNELMNNREAASSLNAAENNKMPANPKSHSFPES